MIQKHLPWLTILLIFGVFLSGCRVGFNFTGGAADTDLETLAVENFGNEANLVVPYLAQNFTEAIQDRFLNQSRLKLTDGPADVRLSGAIRQYRIQPLAIQGNESAAQNRLTIVARVNFENNVNENESWEQDFTGFVDFDAEENFEQIEEDLIEEILDQLTQDIFSKSIGKW